MAEVYPGCYRGVVEAVDDPEARGRYRVRIHFVHPQEIPVEHLPWAEYVAPAGNDWGDLPHFEIGDLVIVTFEGGKREFPFVLGGWLTAPKGVSTLPTRMTDGDYATNRKRWVRTDRAGNVIEVSEVDGERHVYLKSGDAEIEVTQEDDSIRIAAKGDITVESTDGLVSVKASGNVDVEAGGTATVKAPVAKIDSPDIQLGQGVLNGVLTGLPAGTNPIDTFTGKPNPGSTKVKAG